MPPEPAVILIVEDDHALNATLRHLFARAAYTVEHAYDAETALARLDTGGIDLMLLDVFLPGMDGLELCRRVRTSQGSDDVYLPIIMLTGQGSEVDQHAGFAAGADDFVTKPFRISDLLDRIGVWARTRERLKAAHAQVLAEHARLLAEQERSRALAERAAQDEAVVVMARTAADELAQPLTVLRGYLELVGSQRYPTQHIPQVWPELERALAELEERFDRLRCAIRYETKHIGSVKVIDLLRAHEY